MSFSNIQPIPVPVVNAITPQWAADAITRLNSLVNATVSFLPLGTSYGAGAFAFSGPSGNCVMTLVLQASNINGLGPLAIMPSTNLQTATITIAKLTGGGANGSLTFTNGVLTAYTAPT